MFEVLNCVAKNQACDGKIIISQKISPLPSCKTFWFPKQDRDGVGSKQTKTSGVFFQLEPLLTRATYKSWNMWWDVTGCQIETGWKWRSEISQSMWKSGRVGKRHCQRNGKFGQDNIAVTQFTNGASDGKVQIIALNAGVSGEGLENSEQGQRESGKTKMSF